MLNATRLKEIRSGTIDEHEIVPDEQKIQGSVTESEPGNSNEDTRENQVIMKLPPVSSQNPSQAEITISKKVPNEANERGLIDLVDNFFDVQVSLEDPNAA